MLALSMPTTATGAAAGAGRAALAPAASTRGGVGGPTLSSPKPPLPSPPLPPLHNGNTCDGRGKNTPVSASRVEFKEASGGGGGGGDAGGYVPWGLGGVGLAAEAVCAVCDAVGAGPYLIVGYSMGGRVALALAQRRPRLVEGGGGLVLVSSSPGLTR